MIPETIAHGWTEYAKVGDILVTVRVSNEFQIASIKYSPDKPKTAKLINQGITQWVKSPFRHTMFLQHFLRDLFPDLRWPNIIE